MIPDLQSRCQASEIKIYNGLHFLIPKSVSLNSPLSQQLSFGTRGKLGTLFLRDLHSKELRSV